MDNQILIGGLLFAAIIGGMAAWYFHQNKKTSAPDGKGAGSPPRPPVDPK